MPKTKNTKILNPLQSFINGELSLQKRADFIDKVTAGCNISISTFYKRLKNPALFSPFEQKTISQLAQKPINELFKD